MKIKTITCHDVYNAGAGLQAYALSKYLSDLGHDVEIIDYKPDYLSNHYSFTAIASPRFDKPIVRELYLLAKLPNRLKRYFGRRKKSFDAFKQDYLKVTEKRYISNDDLKANIPQADVFFAGSDQIWNPTFNNGKDPAFYLDFVPDNKIKASYAASFSVNEIPDELKAVTKGYLENLDYISVREKSGVDILNSLGINNSYQVLDPVFLLDKQEWEKLCFDISTDKYILVYDFDNSELVKEIAQKIAKEKNLKIYSVFNNSYSDKCFYDEGPIGFVSLVKNADFVISNSFHATAFSLIFEKDFVVVNRKENLNTRMYDLTKSLGIENRLICDANDVDYNENIDYKSVKEKLNEQISYSKKYLDRVLTNGKEKDTFCY